jgi:2,3-bisphosphoglycerate-dependent phosphoglycerate mutase
MTIGMRQGSVTTEIGSGRLFHSLMSTVAVHLENGNWGTRYPLLMGQLYQGSLSVTDVDAAMAEALAIKSGLRKLGPESVIWDIEDLTQAPPWGTVVGTHVTSMAEYFVTSTGRNLLNEIIANLESLKEFGGTLDIISYDGVPRF